MVYAVMQTTVKQIWDFLITFFPNPYGVAGLIGNLFAESSLNPQCVTGGGLKTKEARQQYILDVKKGVISKEQFAHDGIAFGLAQWCYWSRKEDFYSYCEDHGFEIDDQNGQLNYLHYEIAKYKTVQKTLISAKSVKEASDIIMERYLKPANMSDQAKEKRAAFGQDFFDVFADESEPVVKGKYVITTAQNVNLRCGDGKNYAAVDQVKTKGTKLKWVATSESGWHAVESTAKNGKRRVLWISPDFSELRSG